MTKQIYWEDVDVGSEVIPLPKVCTTQMIVKFQGASGDFNPLHNDDVFAATQGVGKPIIVGALKRQWLVQLMTDWIGEQGTLKKFSCQFRGVDYPRRMISHTEPEKGETWWCKGTVTQKYTEGDEHWVKCEIWVENGKGERTTPGSAAVILPSRG